MPTNLTDNPVYTSPVVAPVDGDSANASSVTQGLQPLANRTAYFNQILNTSGVTMVRYGSLATMAALTGMASNSVFYVEGYGLYFYDSTSVASADGVFVVTATGGGRWINDKTTILNASIGLAATGMGGASSGKLLASVIPNRIVSVSKSSTLTGGVATNSTTYIDVPSYSISLTATAGDLLHIHWQGDFDISGTVSANNFGTFAPNVIDGATNHLQCEAVVACNNATVPQNKAYNSFFTYDTVYTVINSGSITIGAQYKINNASDSFRMGLLAGGTTTYPLITCTQVRP